jgi:hypothetical protein
MPPGRILRGMNGVPRLIYLHGFASSPGSNKATRFAEAVRQRGVAVEIPDLNEGDFRNLTLSRQVRLVERLAAGDSPLVIVGSSMGGYVAALHAAREPRVVALVLLAPAFDFHRRWLERVGESVATEWRRRGWMPVMHYATNQMEFIGWSLIEDAGRHPPFPEVTVPTLLIHGRRDETVDPGGSLRFAAGRANVELVLLDSDHSLADAVDEIIARAIRFLARWFPALRD